MHALFVTFKFTFSPGSCEVTFFLRVTPVAPKSGII